MKVDLGLIGLAVMGENLAMNIESKGYSLAVYNRMKLGRESVAEKFVNGRGREKNFIATNTVKDFVDSLESPRKIMLMIKAGKAIDQTIAELLPFLSKGDIIIDGGNSDYRDTERRVRELEEKGFYFIGAGVSGGEEGALKGPSIMPGGSPEAWPFVKNILQDISAKLDDGSPCCEWLGVGGAGHFVKMVHNGIEYGDMQLIAEAYSILKGKGLDNGTISDLFAEWNKTELDSFLVEITANILRYKDVDDGYLIDKILDTAGQKGTGKLSTIAALDEGEPLTMITEAVYSRLLSSLLDERIKASSIYNNLSELTRQSSLPLSQPTCLEISQVRDALYLSKLISYAQGFSLLRRASKNFEWDLNLGNIASIWRKGCIIRSTFLEKIIVAFEANPDLENLLFDDFFSKRILLSIKSWRKVVSESILDGRSIPVMSSALSYFDGLRCEKSSANLLQAQRDYFGAHTYERVDKPRGEFFHTNWTSEGGDTVSGNYTI